MKISEDMVEQIDWQELHEQKCSLLAILESIGDSRHTLHGLVHLIDSIQDSAVDDHRLDERFIFHIWEQS